MKDIEEILKSFINTKRSISTKNCYERYLKELFSYKNIKTLDDFRNLEMDDYYDFKNYMLQQGLSENSIRPKLSAISNFYDFLIRREEYDITKNIIANSELFNNTKGIVNPQHTTWLDEVESRKFLSCCRGKRELAMCAIFLNTGIRVSELINLKKSTMNLFKDENGDDVSTIVVTRKGGKMQVIYFNPFVTKCVKEYLKVRKESNLDYLFVSNQGTKMTTQSIDRTIKKIKNRAGIERPISAHSLRRSAATNMYNSGFRVDEIQDVLGHNSPGTTQIYLKEIQDRSRKVFENYTIGV